ncbi:MAG: glycosyltransferase family 4 protein [Chloroflexi bacterium]|nr:MAG: glycosyltransferase family 4 protein [Chloroflexota bacterium]
MRLLMLNNEFPPLGGGTGTVNDALLRRFAQMPELEIDLITSALGRRPEQVQVAERIRIFKVPVNNQNIHHSSNRELLTYAARALPLALKLYRARPYDLCFAWSAVPAGGIALALSRLEGLNYLVRVCGPDIPGFERRYQAIYPVLAPAIRAIWRGASAVVAKCDGEAQMINAVDGRVPVTMIANGVDIDSFQPGERVEAGGPLRLLCVARLIERKGQHHLIAAVKRLADAGVDVRLDLVGTGDAQAADQAQARALGVEHLVHFVGYVPREQIAAHYAAAHVFVLPSYNEGMSVATLEAMAAGLPVVVTRTGGTAELVGEGVNGLTFDWADVDTLTAHIRQLAQDRALVAQMSTASRQRATQFSWDAAAHAYLELFDRLNMRSGSAVQQRVPGPADASALPLEHRRVG